MKTIYHASESRGKTSLDWLNSYHTFSFSGYYDMERMNFGALRVLNDDTIQGGKGFDTHSHENMEIISIVTSGALKHKDSMGNSGTIVADEVQIMSAGTGVSHSEMNKSKKDKTEFLQIWILPKEKDIKPRYEQKKYDLSDNKNSLVEIVSPSKKGNGVWINQDAYFHLGEMNEGTKITYNFIGKECGVYVFVISGAIEVGGFSLNKKDGLEVYDTDEFEITANKESKILVIEVPFNF